MAIPSVKFYFICFKEDTFHERIIYHERGKDEKHSMWYKYFFKKNIYVSLCIKKKNDRINKCVDSTCLSGGGI